MELSLNQSLNDEPVLKVGTNYVGITGTAGDDEKPFDFKSATFFLTTIKREGIIFIFYEPNEPRQLFLNSSDFANPSIICCLTASGTFGFKLF